MLDFNAIIPMPAILLDVDESTLAEMGAKMIMYRAERSAPFADHADWACQRIREDLGMKGEPINDVAAAYLEKHPAAAEQGRKRLQAILETGFASWYPWAIANWGTKWDAFRFAETGEDPYSFRFETAWSFPLPVFNAIAARYPDLAFDCATYDEGDNFAGEGWFNPPGSEQAFSIGKATDALYERVYGRTKPIYDDEGDEV